MWIRVIRGDNNDNLRVSHVSARILLEGKLLLDKIRGDKKQDHIQYN